MLKRVLWAVPMALAWMPLTATISIDGFFVGLLISYIVLSVLFVPEQSTPIKLHNLPIRIVYGILYMIILFRDICLSAIDVSKRILNPAMPLNPGIIAVSTQINSTDDKPLAGTLAAISAHGITITPGELVVDFDGNQTMYIHCLDVIASKQVAESNQSKRMGLLRRILQ